jgi:hypothetical protein
MIYCCPQFREDAERVGHKLSQFEQGEDGDWNINGCCGGGCFVVSGMKFCPYCGSALNPEGVKDNDDRR